MANMTALDRCKQFGVANIRGMAYMPGPSDYTKTSQGLYENSDFYNNIFFELWSERSPNQGEEYGRRDLGRFSQQLGVNFIHCYDWAAPITQKDQNGVPQTFLEHLTFLKLCNHYNMKATIPISNYTLQLLIKGATDAARTNVERIIPEIYQSGSLVPGVGMWKIFNEFELSEEGGGNPMHVVTAIRWLVEWEQRNNIADQNKPPIMICTSFGVYDGIEGAGYFLQVRNAMFGQSGNIGPYTPEQLWNERIVFATNPQREGSAIGDYLSNRLPAYWRKYNIAPSPVMFTELGSSIEQAGNSEAGQAEWLTAQIAASKPGGSNGMMLGACIFLNEERRWEAGWEKTFGIMRIESDTGWGWPKQNYQARTKFPVWDPNGWYWQQEATYPVEQQAPKLNYRSVAKAWKQG
ncbi:hypothetical protein GCM10007874_32010 [Labrys miyagiensis]|uniref:Glycoside hydrolase family 5 domain-containing protein n=1 Tax=Labrys miyagiensis TaxID=346912 RepID=A0ABQ6CIZ1_9HYPH|nr:hypothetical protein [Labrys miyagiensis]GLS20184.1 hypothetical protein GCM10007874_32010 [Labrys miyagiensis]